MFPKDPKLTILINFSRKSLLTLRTLLQSCRDMTSFMTCHVLTKRGMTGETCLARPALVSRGAARSLLTPTKKKDLVR